MKVLIKAGTPAWIIKEGVNVPTPLPFSNDTMVEVERGDTYWYRLKGQLTTFPKAHSHIIINEVYIASADSLTRPFVPMARHQS